MSRSAPAPDLEMAEALETELQRSLESLSAPYSEIERMVRHHFGWLDGPSEGRGKRLRPRLCLLCARDAGGDWRTALPAAAAVELIHNFSLIHDDIQDASETRRGRPTVWATWGVPQAINTGDFVFVAAHLACQRLLDAGAPARMLAEAMAVLDRAVLSLALGQHLDLAFETRDNVSGEEYLEMIGGKTAALLGASAEIGALVGGATDEARGAYQRFGWNLGMAFQLLDDLLGIWGDPETTGKSAGDDLRRRKKTYPVLLGLAESSEFRRLWHRRPAGDPRLATLQRALDATRAQEDTRRQAAGFTKAAREALGAVPGAAAGRQALESLADSLLRRDR